MKAAAAPDPVRQNGNLTKMMFLSIMGLGQFVELPEHTGTHYSLITGGELKGASNFHFGLQRHASSSQGYILQDHW